MTADNEGGGLEFGVLAPPGNKRQNFQLKFNAKIIIQINN